MMKVKSTLLIFISHLILLPSLTIKAQVRSSSTDIPCGDTVAIQTQGGSIIVKNFYKFAYSINNSPGYYSVTLKRVDLDQRGYKILYGSHGFDIVIFNPESSDEASIFREEAEKDFISILDIEKDSACRLLVNLEVAIDARHFLAKLTGINYGLSFCSNGSQIPNVKSSNPRGKVDRSIFVRNLKRAQSEAASSGEIPCEDTFAIPTASGSVKVRNFYEIATAGNPVFLESAYDGEYSLFWIKYYPNENRFEFDINEYPKGELMNNREKAERFFLALLNIERKDACRLNIHLTVPSNKSLAGVNYGLSFCPDGKPFPASPQAPRANSRSKRI